MQHLNESKLKQSESGTNEIPDANDYSVMTPQEKRLGTELVRAFHNKQSPETIRKLVKEGAPVHIRLDYGLSVAKEAEFVAQLALLFSDDQNAKSLLHSVQKILDPEQAQKMVDYIKTGIEIFHILNNKNTNSKFIPVNKQFKQFILDNAPNSRFNPDMQNGSLIISAGLEEPDFLRQVLEAGKKRSDIKPEKNGAHVNFTGYFDGTAAEWSSILLDAETLKILLENGSQHKYLGITGSSLLHWVTVAARLDDSPERQEKANLIARLLLAKGARVDIPNKLGETASDYARGELATLLRAHVKTSMGFFGRQATTQQLPQQNKNDDIKQRAGHRITSRL